MCHFWALFLKHLYQGCLYYFSLCTLLSNEWAWGVWIFTKRIIVKVNPCWVFSHQWRISSLSLNWWQKAMSWESRRSSHEIPSINLHWICLSEMSFLGFNEWLLIFVTFTFGWMHILFEFLWVLRLKFAIYNLLLLFPQFIWEKTSTFRWRLRTNSIFV